MKLTPGYKMELSSRKDTQLIRNLTPCLLIKKEDLLLDHNLAKLGSIIKLEAMPTVSIHLLEIKFFIFKAQRMEDGYWLLSLNS